jgi:hypothetical protein
VAEHARNVNEHLLYFDVCETFRRGIFDGHGFGDCELQSLFADAPAPAVCNLPATALALYLAATVEFARGRLHEPTPLSQVSVRRGTHLFAAELREVCDEAVV